MQADYVGESLEPDYNVAPTKPVYGVLDRREREGAPGGEATGQVSPSAAAKQPEAQPRGNGCHQPVTRQLRVLRWGLVPYWAKDPSLGSKLINARAETVAVKPAFRRAFARRRCLLPADGYYEWQAGAAVGGRVRKKQPFFVSPSRRERPRHGRALRVVARARSARRRTRRLAVDGDDNHDAGH